MTRQTKRTFCRVCEPACGMIAEVEGDELVALKPDYDHPVTKGFVCHKGIYGKDIQNDPDRLKVPLKRNSSGGFDEISWDQALSEIGAKLTQVITDHGGGAVAGYRGNPSAFNSLFGPAWGGFFSQIPGVKMFSSGTQDAANKFAGGQAVFGTSTVHTLPDIDHADLILLFGENPAVSHMTFFSIPDPMGKLRAAEERGARVIYINPRKIESARFAGEVLQIKPDTDVYLLAAMLAEIDRTVGFDEDAVARHGRGVEELREFIAGYDLDEVARITGIEADVIRQLAHDFATTKKAAAHMATGLNMGRQGTVAYWLYNMLVFLTGHLGVEGGNFYSLGFYARSPGSGKGDPDTAPIENTKFGPMRKASGVGGELPGVLMADILQDPESPVRAMIVNGGNPVLSVGGEERTRAALEGLEMLVCIDIYRSATAELADYVLPAAGAFEREDVNILGIGMQYEPYVQYTEAVVPAGFERKPEWWIFGKLSQAMGLRSIFDGLPEGETPDLWGRVNAMLKSRGHDFEELKRDEIIQMERSKPEEIYEIAIHTEDGRINCFPGALNSSRQRMQDIYDELKAEPDDALKLITIRGARMMNTWYANLPKMKTKGHDRNFLYMHPDDARIRQLRDGQTVRVHNGFGDVNIELKISEDMRPGVVGIEHGFGHSKNDGMSFAKKTAGVNANSLLPHGPGAYDPISNQAHMSGIPVDVERG
ncbi:MAG: molybdopterin-dependent oxidoreductase [Alphaproteobacteria bacterium]|nr:molybdopterin-dependent oxidoreductase [Alphaproteobacteria bacterium]